MSVIGMNVVTVPNHLYSLMFGEKSNNSSSVNFVGCLSIYVFKKKRIICSQHMKRNI